MHAIFALSLSLSLGWVSPEIHLSPTTSEPSYTLRYFPAVAFNGSVYLVAWEDQRVPAGIYLSRVASDGTVLDPEGVRLAAGSHPSIATSGSEFFVVWDGENGNNRSIFGQRVSSTGAFVGSQVMISPINDYFAPAVSYDGTNYVVAWASLFSGNVSAARVSTTGSVLDTTPIVVDSAAVGSFDERPLSIASIVGTTLIAYETTTGGGCTVEGKRLLGNGQLADSTTLVLSSKSGLSDYCQPTAATDGSGFAVSYALDLSAGSEVRMVRVPATGAASAEATVAAGYNEGVNWSVTPAIVSSGGNWLVVWNEALRDGLRAMRMSSSGTRVDSAPKAISSEGTEDVAAAAGSGGVLAVYGRLSKSSTIEYHVEGARLDSSAALLGTSAISRTARPQVSTSYAPGNGQGFVAWVDGPGNDGRKRVVGTRVGRDGQPLDTPPIDVGLGVNLPWEVSTAFDGTDYVVAWSEYVNLDAGINVYAMRVHPDGGLGSATPIPVATTTGNERYPQIAGGGGDALVCWDLNGKSFSCSAVHADGGTANAFAKTTNAMYGSRFAAGYDGTDWLVAWSDETGSINPKIYAQRLAAGTFATLGGPRQVGPFAGVTVNSMSVAGGPDGYLVAYIKDALYSSRALYATRLSPDGGQLDTSVPAYATGGAVESFGGISASWNGDWIVGWQESRTGTGSDVLIRRLTDAGVWMDSSAVVIAGNADEEVSAAVGPLGDAIAVAYVRADSTPTEAQPRARLRLFSTLAAPGTSCSDGSDCGTGACVGGVCCETFCNDACTGGVCQTPKTPDAGVSGSDAGTTENDGGTNAVSFTSTPPASAGCGQTFDYQPQVEGTGPLLFSLSKSPEGMTVDSASGHVSWTPRADQEGTFEAELVVSSSAGFTRQSFTVEGACARLKDDLGPNAGGCHCGAVDGSFALFSFAALLLRRRRTAR